MWPKNSVKRFYGWKQKTLIQLYGWTTEGVVFQGCRWIYFLVLLFCKLLWSDLGEPVSMMKCNPSCSMDTLYALCKSRFCKRIGAELSGEQRDKEKGNIYMMLVEVKEADFWQRDEAKFLVLKLMWSWLKHVELI